MTTNSGGHDDPTRARLAELRSSASRRAVDLASDFEAIVDAATDVATDDEHDPEGHTIAWERQQLAALLAEARGALADIDAAEQRLDDGRYGRCTNCDRPIDVERLEALPATPTCLGCAGRSGS